MTESDWIWLGLIAVGAAFEGYTLRNGKEGDTLSETTRSLFRVKTSKLGRASFLVAWLGFSGWYLGHILDWWK
jgi:hypothetical protein